MNHASLVCALFLIRLLEHEHEHEAVKTVNTVAKSECYPSERRWRCLHRHRRRQKALWFHSVIVTRSEKWNSLEFQESVDAFKRSDKLLLSAGQLLQMLLLEQQVQAMVSAFQESFNNIRLKVGSH